jgi:hypothetical protein
VYTHHLSAAQLFFVVTRFALAEVCAEQPAIPELRENDELSRLKGHHKKSALVTRSTLQNTN